jgi:4-hydroxy-tetrahydrodipicolinate reductase
VQSVREDATFLVGRHENGKRTKQEIGIHSLRMGNTVGIHEVIINTGTQLITLKHEAQDRSLFAEGALDAARFMVSQPAGLYNMDDIVK